MSRTTKKILKEVEVRDSSICDGCGAVEIDDGWNMELQEWLHWAMRGGYNSIFGDERLITLDLCQKCTKARLGDVLQFPELDKEDE